VPNHSTTPQTDVIQQFRHHQGMLLECVTEFGGPVAQSKAEKINQHSAIA
jgi:hypothetical protein